MNGSDGHDHQAIALVGSGGVNDFWRSLQQNLDCHASNVYQRIGRIIGLYRASVNSWLQNPDETQNESVDEDVLNIKDEEDRAFGQVHNYQENLETQFGVKLVQPMMF